MKGIIYVLIVKRIATESQHYKDKWEQVDKLKLIAWSYPGIRERVYRVISIKRGLGEWIITKDEVAFIKLIYGNYGSGDYCIRTWDKGKRKVEGEIKGTFKRVGKTGIYTFWDGIISDSRMFYRRQNTGWLKDNPSSLEKHSFADSDQRIRNYLKTKRSGIWYSF